MKTFPLLTLLLLSALFTGCKLSDDDGPAPIVRFVDELIASDPNLDTFREALARTGLDSTLANVTPFTLFAPTDDAFAAAGIDVTTMDSTELTNFLRYHLINGLYLGRQNLQPSASYINTTYDISPNGAAIPVLFVRGEGENDITINGTTNVVAFELAGSNGVVQKINTVLTPPTLLQTVRNNSVFSDFAGLIDAASPLADGSAVADSLAGTGPVTLFVPFNSASSQNLGLTEDDSRDVVLYHMLGGRNDQLRDFRTSYTTLEGGRLNVSNRNLFTESNQSVLVTLENVQCTNGILHVIDEILLPEGF